MNNYKQQVSLLLQVLPEVAKEPDFALHGGTAINLSGLIYEQDWRFVNAP